MRDLVLVHGAWHGGWCWAPVQRLLVAAGHRVFAPSLTGLADRAHLFGAQVSLATHVQDICALAEYEGLDDFVLVGHSYGGNVITGVADRLRERIAHLVYLDAIVPADNATRWRWADHASPSLREKRIAAIRTQGGGVMFAPPPASTFGLSDARQCAWVDRHLTPMPAACYLEPIELSGQRCSTTRRSYVAAAGPAFEPMAHTVESIRGRPDWTFRTIDAGHDMMVSAPDDLAALLLEFAR